MVELGPLSKDYIPPEEGVVTEQKMKTEIRNLVPFSAGVIVALFSVFLGFASEHYWYVFALYASMWVVFAAYMRPYSVELPEDKLR